jgi:hypothetical protein
LVRDAGLQRRDERCGTDRHRAVLILAFWQVTEIDKPIDEFVIDLNRNAEAARLAPVAQTTSPIGGVAHAASFGSPRLKIDG